MQNLVMPETVIVIGGGESVANMNVNEICKRGYSIGVNDAAVFAPVHIGVSMDRRWTEYRYHRLKEQGLYLHLRRSAIQNIEKDDEYKAYEIFDCNHETDQFSNKPGILNGRNSGYCAFNLAYQMKPKKIYLFGFDMGGSYWYPPYPWVSVKQEGSRILQVWREAFKTAWQQCQDAGIEVFIVGKSRIQDFPTISYEKFLEC
jgi:hypothetical protein